MSLGGDIMTEHYDELVQGFLKKLEDMKVHTGIIQEHLLLHIIREYRKHFKNNGIYGS